MGKRKDLKRPRHLEITLQYEHGQLHKPKNTKNNTPSSPETKSTHAKCKPRRRVRKGRKAAPSKARNPSGDESEDQPCKSVQLSKQTTTKRLLDAGCQTCLPIPHLYLYFSGG
ncbi:hypothetical protein IV203_023301 [Nitzschia inconspicua]|uniref:Uncharacterized protein n=1 Tax=Nitzschia inconspicua TaxID=303405 RepID=A0A9K3PBY9_9STRA|nr:hypothetical protein IV203_023301 [Nitzschia inconspicua]